LGKNGAKVGLLPHLLLILQTELTPYGTRDNLLPKQANI
jgi:hypothetical protein